MKHYIIRFYESFTDSDHLLGEVNGRYTCDCNAAMAALQLGKRRFPDADKLRILEIVPVSGGGITHAEFPCVKIDL